MAKTCSDNINVKAGILVLEDVNYFPKLTEFSQENFKLILKEILDGYGINLNEDYDPPNDEDFDIKDYIKFLEEETDMGDNYIDTEWEDKESLRSMSVPKFNFNSKNPVLARGFLIWNGYIFKHGYEFKFPLDLTDVKKCVVLNSSSTELNYDYYDYEDIGDETTPELEQLERELNITVPRRHSMEMAKIISYYFDECPEEFEEDTEYYLLNEEEEGKIYDDFLVEVTSPKIPFAYLTVEYHDEDGDGEDNFEELFNIGYISTNLEITQLLRGILKYLED